MILKIKKRETWQVQNVLYTIVGVQYWILNHFTQFTFIKTQYGQSWQVYCQICTYVLGQELRRIWYNDVWQNKKNRKNLKEEWKWFIHYLNGISKQLRQWESNISCRHFYGLLRFLNSLSWVAFFWYQKMLLLFTIKIYF